MTWRVASTLVPALTDSVVVTRQVASAARGMVLEVAQLEQAPASSAEVTCGATSAHEVTLAISMTVTWDLASKVTVEMTQGATSPLGLASAVVSLEVALGVALARMEVARGVIWE